MILVTGATGQFGSAAIKSLIGKGIKGNDIKALVRNEQAADELKTMGVGVITGDYDDYASLVHAFSGIEKLLFISGSDISKRLGQHQNVINAAIEAHVKHVVYTSFQRKNESEQSPLWIVGQSHMETEKLLRKSGIDHTIMRNNLYMDFLPGFIGEKVLESGVIYVPAQDGKISPVLRAEMAEAAATILSTTGHEGKEYDFTNPEAVSYKDIAEYISEISGKTIQYVSPSAEEYTTTLAGFGVPAEVIGIFTSFAVAQAKGELDTKSNDMEDLLGRKPLSVRSFLKNVYSGESAKQ